MRLREKGSKKDEGIVHMDFGQAQAALQSGAYEVVEEAGEAGPEIHGGSWGADPAPVEAKEVKKADTVKAADK
ncbi:hypothetical protein [Methylobacterium thuringiense]|uniref:Uncharacterized protein n=1 Tax=Methylobacterium thuringiense TaxID=1003091 RepID=A0ABQ4TIY5_9HYPH|nr:hypothetical protein [Methylobacterium thuringiense]GJE54573.1 hypothetical protein EKPJFOCH_1051 [Methylobacterium thuringiense]